MHSFLEIDLAKFNQKCHMSYSDYLLQKLNGVHFVVFNSTHETTCRASTISL